MSLVSRQFSLQLISLEDRIEGNPLVGEMNLDQLECNTRTKAEDESGKRTVENRIRDRILKHENN
jgi:hypothetical protein